MSEGTTIEATPAASATFTGEMLGTGRRKTAVARVRIVPGHGKIEINQRPLEQYFPSDEQQRAVIAPLVKLGNRERFDIKIRVHGGGPTGQADACKLGIARALKSLDTTFDKPLRDAGLLTRDSRMKERKKYGLHGARRGVQFSKR
jgi:small subunit ribosomal protein S9